MTWVVARPGIKTVADLNGKKIGVELGLVDHLLLLGQHARKERAEADSDGDVEGDGDDGDAAGVTEQGCGCDCGVRQPNSGNALRQVPGSTTIFFVARIMP